MSDALDDPFTGLLTRLSRLPARPGDPDVVLWGGATPPWGPRLHERPLGGAGWDDDAARLACVGEALERLQAYALPVDATRRASFRRWSLDEAALGPDRWVLFHEDQHRAADFPFARFTPDQELAWVCFRDAAGGEPAWVPAELGYLDHDPSPAPRISPSYSTGLSCGTSGQPILLRGVQEAIERDAIVGAWWGRYPLEEWPASELLRELDPALPGRILRPHRAYRFYRVRTPFSDHATVVTLEGVDREGFLFAAGSACRETRAASWMKSLLEAIQGAAYVRQLRTERGGLDWVDERADFPHHASYYSAHPGRLKDTVFRRAIAPEGGRAAAEPLDLLRERLGPGRPVLFRLMTPPVLAPEHLEWTVLRVLVPGLQPLHGNDRWPQLGGPLWSRPLGDWPSIPPHPFA
jgi:ribosomal protein S12 methylthiotransferase accessory factor